MHYAELDPMSSISPIKLLRIGGYSVSVLPLLSNNYIQIPYLHTYNSLSCES